MLTLEAVVAHTWQSTIIGDETSHVNRLAVNREIPHAANKLSVVHWEIFRQVWDTTKEERAS